MNNIAKHQVDKIVRYLEAVKMRPPMYIAKDIPPVFSFLDGFAIACEAFGVELHRQYADILSKVSAERGWKYLSDPLWDQMRQRGLNDDEITQEMLAIYVEVWRRVGNSLSQEE